ncbi:MAG: plasmid pRiA4b ORF-3 family protein [Cyanobacteria bacterium P01_H01_bin.15]
MAATKSGKVPAAMQAKFDSIIKLTDDFAEKYLDPDYAELIRYATAALARKRPSPIAKGQAKSWAAGITHAIGMVNFLYDPSQEPHIKASDLYKAFGVSRSSGQSKSKTAREALDTFQMDPNWCVPRIQEMNPLSGLMQMDDGMIVKMPSDGISLDQIIKTAKSMSDLSEDELVEMAEQLKANLLERAPENRKPGSPKNLYVLEVNLLDGPISEEFAEKNPIVCRTIEIKGSHTLVDLHHIIFKAFERADEHLYEFQIGGRGPNDPLAARYGLPGGDDLTGLVTETTIASLGLEKDEPFGYWFDFGDDWWHQVSVLDILEQAPKGKFPRITEQEGASPPQYPELD